jgi:CspA family cold shock protein
MAQGTVKWFNDSGVWLHRRKAVRTSSSLTPPSRWRVRSLAEGDRVEFEVVKGPKGLQAQNVRKQWPRRSGPRGVTRWSRHEIRSALPEGPPARSARDVSRPAGAGAGDQVARVSCRRAREAPRTTGSRPTSSSMWSAARARVSPNPPPAGGGSGLDAGRPEREVSRSRRVTRGEVLRSTPESPGACSQGHARR